MDESKKEAKIALDLAKSIHSKALNTSDSVSGLIEVRNKKEEEG